MSRLKTDTVTIRGEAFKIREWTPSERKGFLQKNDADRYMAGVYLAWCCTLNDTGGRLFTSEKFIADEEPTELSDELAAAILKLSGSGARSAEAEDPGKKD